MTSPRLSRLLKHFSPTRPPPNPTHGSRLEPDTLTDGEKHFFADITPELPIFKIYMEIRDHLVGGAAGIVADKRSSLVSSALLPA